MPDPVGPVTSTSGFVFDSYDAEALGEALGRALEAHADPSLWQTLVRRGMRQDWSWESSARAYLRLFERTCDQPPSQLP